jgi:hypothetical protein
MAEKDFNGLNNRTTALKKIKLKLHQNNTTNLVTSNFDHG